jgi:hypothetical protein
MAKTQNRQNADLTVFCIFCQNACMRFSHLTPNTRPKAKTCIQPCIKNQNPRTNTQPCKKYLPFHLRFWKKFDTSSRFSKSRLHDFKNSDLCRLFFRFRGPSLIHFTKTDDQSHSTEGVESIITPISSDHFHNPSCIFGHRHAPTFMTSPTHAPAPTFMTSPTHAPVPTFMTSPTHAPVPTFMTSPTHAPARTFSSSVMFSPARTFMTSPTHAPAPTFWVPWPTLRREVLSDLQKQRTKSIPQRGSNL